METTYTKRIHRVLQTSLLMLRNWGGHLQTMLFPGLGRRLAHSLIKRVPTQRGSSGAKPGASLVSCFRNTRTPKRSVSSSVQLFPKTQASRLTALWPEMGIEGLASARRKVMGGSFAQSGGRNGKTHKRRRTIRLKLRAPR